MEPARRILLAAWADVAMGFYEWAVFKAWRAALTALAGAGGGLGPRGLGSTAYLAAGLSGSCGGLGGLWRCASRLDALAAPLLYPEVESLLGVELGYGRAHALESIECSLRLASALRGCGEARAAVPAGLLREWLEGLEERLEEASIIDAGGVYLLALGEARGKPYAARVEALGDSLPPAMALVLAPEEAAIILGLPGWSRGNLVFVRDDYGLEAARGKLL